MLNKFWHTFLMLTESKVRPASGIKRTVWLNVRFYPIRNGSKMSFLHPDIPFREMTTPTADPKTGISQLNRLSQIISIATALIFCATDSRGYPASLSPTNLGGWMKGATVTNYGHNQFLKGHETELWESLGCETTRLKIFVGENEEVMA